MALIPMRQSVKITRVGASNGWGHGSETITTIHKARVSEETKTVKNEMGQETLSTMTVYLDRLPNITYEDVIEYTNELDVTIKRKPIAIQPRRGLNGKALLTEVNV